MGLKKWKAEDGSLTVEASLVLIFFIFVMMLFLSFGRIYRAQNYVTHLLMQTSQGMAQDYYIYKTASEGTKAGAIGSSIYDLLGAIADLKPFKQVTEYMKQVIGWNDITSAVDAAVVKQYMAASMNLDRGELDDRLKKLGLENGVETLEFSRLELDNGDGDVVFEVKYKVKFLFPFLNYEEAELHQTVRSHIWKTK